MNSQFIGAYQKRLYNEHQDPGNAHHAMKMMGRGKTHKIGKLDVIGLIKAQYGNREYGYKEIANAVLECFFHFVVVEFVQKS
jgi:hypothetical protein